MSIDDIFLLALAFLASLYVTTKFMSSAVDDIDTKVRERLNKIIRPIKIETHNETMYWFDRETDQFLAQGKTQQEISATLKQRFPSLIFVNEAHEEILAGPDFEVTDLKTFMEKKAKDMFT
jgi:hypothetical protein